jgi:hypothetical protein
MGTCAAVVALSAVAVVVRRRPTEAVGVIPVAREKAVP